MMKADPRKGLSESDENPKRQKVVIFQPPLFSEMKAEARS